MTGDPLARYNAITLAVAQSFGGAVAPMAIALGGLVGITLLPAEQIWLATLPVSIFIFGAALSAIPAALMMRRFGRRAGTLLGAAAGGLGGVTALAALSASSFTLFCLAMAFTGVCQAFVQQYRFIAADTASDSYRPMAISIVMIGGMFAGVIGPQTARYATDLIPGMPYGGAYVAQIGLCVIMALILWRLRAPPAAQTQFSTSGRPLPEIMRQPRFIVSVGCAVASYALMSFVMTAGPVAMVEICGHSRSSALWGIQWHVLAMFGPSFFTGKLISRFGSEAITAAGLIILLLTGLIGLHGISLVHFWTVLILLGLGWNFGFIGATAMLTETYRPEERAKVQAINDFIVVGSAAFASFNAANVLFRDGWGWAGIMWIIFPVSILAAAALFSLVRMEKRTQSRAS